MSHALKVATYNIRKAVGLDQRRNPERILAVLKEIDADIITLQEVDRHWSRTNHDDQPALLGALLPDHHWVYAPAFDMAVPNDRAKRRQFGPMILSRWPILSPARSVMPKGDLRSRQTQ